MNDDMYKASEYHAAQEDISAPKVSSMIDSDYQFNENEPKERYKNAESHTLGMGRDESPPRGNEIEQSRPKRKQRRTIEEDDRASCLWAMCGIPVQAIHGVRTIMLDSKTPPILLKSRQATRYKTYNSKPESRTPIVYDQPRPHVVHSPRTHIIYDQPRSPVFYGPRTPVAYGSRTPVAFGCRTPFPYGPRTPVAIDLKHVGKKIEPLKSKQWHLGDVPITPPLRIPEMSRPLHFPCDLMGLQEEGEPVDIPFPPSPVKRMSKARDPMGKSGVFVSFGSVQYNHDDNKFTRPIADHYYYPSEDCIRRPPSTEMMSDTHQYGQSDHTMNAEQMFYTYAGQNENDAPMTPIPRSTHYCRVDESTLSDRGSYYPDDGSARMTSQRSNYCYAEEPVSNSQTPQFLSHYPEPQNPRSNYYEDDTLRTPQPGGIMGGYYQDEIEPRTPQPPSQYYQDDEYRAPMDVPSGNFYQYKPAPSMAAEEADYYNYDGQRSPTPRARQNKSNVGVPYAPRPTSREYQVGKDVGHSSYGSRDVSSHYERDSQHYSRLADSKDTDYSKSYSGMEDPNRYQMHDNSMMYSRDKDHNGRQMVELNKRPREYQGSAADDIASVKRKMAQLQATMPAMIDEGDPLSDTGIAPRYGKRSDVDVKVAILSEIISRQAAMEKNNLMRRMLPARENMQKPILVPRIHSYLSDDSIPSQSLPQNLFPNHNRDEGPSTFMPTKETNDETIARLNERIAKAVAPKPKKLPDDASPVAASVHRAREEGFDWEKLKKFYHTNKRVTEQQMRNDILVKLFTMRLTSTSNTPGFMQRMLPDGIYGPYLRESQVPASFQNKRGSWSERGQTVGGKHRIEDSFQGAATFKPKPPYLEEKHHRERSFNESVSSKQKKHLNHQASSSRKSGRSSDQNWASSGTASPGSYKPRKSSTSSRKKCMSQRPAQVASQAPKDEVEEMVFKMRAQIARIKGHLNPNPRVRHPSSCNP